MMEFCAAVDPSPRLAVLGIFTTPSHRAYRDAIRASWMADAEPDVILPRFVLRGIELPASFANESRASSDMVYLRARSSMSRQGGPLLSLLLWFDCAATAWPNAQLVGKADDDVRLSSNPTR